MRMEWQGKPTTFMEPWNHFNFLARRCPEDGSGGSCGRDLRAQPVWEGRYLHHGRNWENLQEGKRNEERLVAVCISCSTPLFLLFHPPSFTVNLLQELLFQLVCLLTTACAIFPRWRVTPMWFWKMGILSKCKLQNWYLYSILLFSCSCSCITLVSDFVSPPNSDLGVHVDGFISNVAHSLIVGVTKVSPKSYAHQPTLFSSCIQEFPLFTAIYGLWNH